ncbi:MAG: RHS repeat protein [Pyrinomonadaceae bacterium]|nr:RHS repeat protein [Pyrinomonadaceae bacterium]
MSNFTNDVLDAVVGPRTVSLFKVFLVFISLLLVATKGVYSQSHTDNAKDQAIRGRGRVNQTSLGLEMRIRLGNYPGRGIDVPVTLNYSSKLWRPEFLDAIPRSNGSGCVSVHSLKYSEHSKAGWTTSISVPYIDYTGQDNLYTTKGAALSEGCLSEGSGANNNAAFVERVKVHLPDGTSHELRKDNSVTIYPRDSNPVLDFDGTYFSPDSSNVKYVENASNNTFRLFLPDGSSYLFSSQVEPLSSVDPRRVRKALEYLDVHGNRVVYDSINRAITDTLGRNIQSPIDYGPIEPTTEQDPQTYLLPGLGDSTIEYKFHWKRLNGGTQAESAMTDISDPDYALKYIADRSSANPNEPKRAEGTYLFESNWENWVQDEGAGLFNPVVLTKIELPEGTQYRFSYDNLGRIERITYPKGALEIIEYGKVPTLNKGSASDISLQTNFGVRSRKLYPDPSIQDAYEWSYEADGSQELAYKVIRITPDGIRKESFLHRGNYESTILGFGSFGFERVLTGKVFEERIFDRSGALIRRNIIDWEYSGFSVPNVPGYPHPIEWHPRVKSAEKYVFDPATGKGLKAVTAFLYEFESELDEIDLPVLKKGASAYDFLEAGNSSEVPGIDTSTAVPPDGAPLTGELVNRTESSFLINDLSVPASVRAAYLANHVITLPSVSESFDNQGRIASRIRFSYDQMGYSTQIGLGNLTETKTWDSSKGPIAENSSYISVKSEFDSFGNNVATTDAKGNRSTTEYDPIHNKFPVKVTGPVPDPDGIHGANTSFVLTSEYDPNTGLLLSKTDANGITTKTEYDQDTLRVTRVRKLVSNTEVGSVSEILYGDAPLDSWVTTRKQIDDSNWSESKAYLDGLGRVFKTETSNSAGNVFVEKGFDSEGRIKRLSAPYREGENIRWAVNEYDDQGRVIKITSPDGSSVRTEFGILVSDRRGTTKTITDQAGRKRTGVTDAAGRMFRIIEDPDGESLETDYIFDSQGRIRETIQGIQNRYYSYDSLGRLKYSKQPEQDANPNLVFTDPVSENTNWALKFEHDKNGNVVRTTDARGVVTTARFDNLNRLQNKTFSDGSPEVDFYYDGYGASTRPARAKNTLTRVSSTVSDTQYLAFDELGRIREMEQSVGDKAYRTLYEYNRSGQLIAETYPSGRRMEYQLDLDGMMIAVKGRKASNTLPSTYLNSVERNSNGDIQKRRLGNGRWESTAFNNRDQVSSISLGHSENGDRLFNLSLDYGTDSNNGAIIGQTIEYSLLPEPIVQQYDYDSLNRIEMVAELAGSEISWREAFEYDRYGNRRLDDSETTILSNFDKITNPAVDSSDNRLLPHQDGDNAPDYTYDAAGNLTRDAENKRYSYNAENKIREYFKPGNASNSPDAVYQYDGNGRRVKTIADGVETVFVYNALGRLIAEYSEKLPETPRIRYLTRDHLGSTRVVTDGGGAVVLRNDFMAFGESVSEKIGNVSGRESFHGYGHSTDLRNQFAGYERDRESGLDFAENRYYSSLRGRFTSIDPLNASADLRNPQTFNRYAYGLNSPFKFVDPLGLLASPTTGCASDCGDSGSEETSESNDSSANAVWSHLGSYYESVAETVVQDNDPVAAATVREQAFSWFTTGNDENGDLIETTVAIGTVALTDEMIKDLGDDAARFQNTREQINASADTVQDAVDQLRSEGYSYSIARGDDGKIALRTTSPLTAKSTANGVIGSLEIGNPEVTSNVNKLLENHNAMVQKRNELYTERKTTFQNKHTGTELNLTSFQSTSPTGTTKRSQVDTKMNRTNLGNIYDSRIGRIAGRKQT